MSDKLGKTTATMTFSPWGSWIPEVEVPTEEWLEKTNFKFRKECVPHRLRAVEALKLYSQDKTVYLGSKAEKRITEYFSENIKEGLNEIGLLFTGVFRYDVCFWSICIPFIYGKIQVKMDSFLDEKMPESIKASFIYDKQAIKEYENICQDCIYYAIQFNYLEKVLKPEDGFIYLKNANGNFISAISNLLSKDSFSSAVQTLGLLAMTVELNLKFFLILKNYKEKDFKDRKKDLGHKLNNLLKEAKLNGLECLNSVENHLSIYGNYINERYTREHCSEDELWICYKIALHLACSVLKSIGKIRP